MQILSFDELESTHTYLKNYIKENGYKNPLCILANSQTKGIGSRGNSWQGKKGNLFFSFVLEKKDLAQDLPIQSASIYFSFILKLVLKDFGSKLYIKWPNDFYIKDKKIGGTITSVSKELVYCGIGLNLIEVDKDFGVLDINIDIKKVLEIYFQKLESKILWKIIFSQFKIEFTQSKNFKASINGEKLSLEEAILNGDGSIQIYGKKVFSLR